MISPKKFTLLELLIVIAVIGILVSMLMPSLSKAREKAKNALCLNNHRQLVIGVHLYANTYNGDLPPQGAFSFTIGWKEEVRGFGYLWQSGIMDDKATDILRDPTYQNVNPDEDWGNDGHFNQMNKSSSHNAWSEWTSKWQKSHVNFGGARWSVPDHWNDYAVNWASSNPDGVNHTFKIYGDYATVYQPIRSSCLWNTGGAPGLPPDGTSWFNAYSHKVQGINISFTDGGAKWLSSGRINSTHGSGYIHHFRNQFWKFGENYKSQ